MPVDKLKEAEGLLIKVKQHGTKEELGHVNVTCSQLFQATDNSPPMELELLHPTKLLPGLCGTVTVKCRPAQPCDIHYYKSHGWGYFQPYTPAENQPEDMQGKDNDFI